MQFGQIQAVLCRAQEHGCFINIKCTCISQLQTVLRLHISVCTLAHVHVSPMEYVVCMSFMCVYSHKVFSSSALTSSSDSAPFFSSTLAANLFTRLTMSLAYNVQLQHITYMYICIFTHMYMHIHNIHVHVHVCTRNTYFVKGTEVHVHVHVVNLMYMYTPSAYCFG